MCRRDACRVFEVFGCLAVIELVVLGQSIAERYRRIVVTSNIIGDFSSLITRQGVGAGDFELIAAIAVDAIERCRTEIRLRTVDRRVEWAAFEAKFITRNRVLVDGDITITSDCIVRIGVISEVNIAEQELIVVGTGISGNTIRMSILAGSICTTIADGILDTRRIKFIIIGKALTFCTRFSIDVLILERSIAIGLRCTAVQDNGTAIDCQLTFVKCCNTVAFQALKRLILDIDVINSKLTIISLTIAICTRSRCGLTSTGQLVAAAIAIHDAAAFGDFLESVRVARDIVRGAIFADEFSFFLSCQVNGFTIDLGLVVSRNGQSRLRLEDVLVRIFRLSIRVEAVAALRTGVPASRRLAVEIRAERVAVWRCGVDFPVAAFAGLDGFLCRGQVLEGTICTACIDDNGITCRGIRLQQAIVRAMRAERNRTIIACAGQMDLILSRDATYRQITISRHIDMTRICRDTVANRYILARNINVVINIDNTRERRARSTRAAADIDIASIFNREILQGDGMTNIAPEIDIAAIAVDDKTGMCKIFFLYKALRRTCSLTDIIPFRCRTKANRYIRTGVVWLHFRIASQGRLTAVPVCVVVLKRFAAVLRKFRTRTTIGQAFRTRYPIVAIPVRGIYRIILIAAAPAADEQRILLTLADKRVFKCRRDGRKIRITRIGTRAACRKSLGSRPIIGMDLQSKCNSS